jgi:poly(3-hydroxybutyrate) depolymerase
MGCFTDVSPGHHQFSCDGSLTYDVEVPAACASGGCGLVLDVHGLTMNADQEDQGSHMRALGDQYGYVVVQPTAPGAIPSWDPTSTFGPLVFSFVQTAAAAMAVDPHRLHGMGFSQGGGMTWWMICHHADVFASMAPLSAGGVAGCTFLGSDVPSQQIPILDAHGHKDNVVNFQLSAIPQRDAALAYWQFGPGAVFEMDSAHTATRYLTDGGTPFEFYEHDYQAGSSLLGGHCFPGGTDVGPLPDQFGCADPQQFDWGQRAMDFFRAHPRP